MEGFPIADLIKFLPLILPATGVVKSPGASTMLGMLGGMMGQGVGGKGPLSGILGGLGGAPKAGQMPYFGGLKTQGMSGPQGAQYPTGDYGTPADWLKWLQQSR